MTEDLSIAARAAGPGDASTIAELRSLALAELHGARGGALHFDHDRPGQDWSEAPGIALVGSIDGVVVGHGEVVLDVGPTHRIALVTDLYVHPDARGVGVGAAMLASIEHWAAGQGATHLESQVLPGLRDSKNFFERMGMVTRLMRVSRPLD